MRIWLCVFSVVCGELQAGVGVLREFFKGGGVYLVVRVCSVVLH